MIKFFENIQRRIKSRRFLLISAEILCVFICLSAMLFFIKPNFILNGEKEEFVEVFSEYSDSGAEAKFLWIDLTGKIECGSDPECEVIGTYEKEYTLRFLWHRYKIVRTVNVTDNIAPEITLGEDIAAMTPEEFASEPGCSVTDNYDGDITDKIQVTKEYDSGESMLTLRYSAVDSSGNEAVIYKTVEINDITPPELTLVGDVSMNVTEAVFDDPGAKATDNVEGDITDRITVDTNYRPRKSGEFYFIYNVSDGAGNASSVRRDITVTDVAPPIIKFIGEGTVYIDEGEFFSDSGVMVKDAFDGNMSGKVSVSGEVDTDTPGTYTITYNVTDSNGNSSYARRTVVVIEAPDVLDIPFISQLGKYPNGCESVSTVMALQYAGIDITVDSFIDDYLDMCETPRNDENRVQWCQSPEEYFIGDPREKSGMFCYAHAIKKACDKFVDDEKYSVTELRGVTLDSLCNSYIDNGIPVVIWATINMSTPGATGVQWRIIGTNETFKWIAPLHCVLMTGYDSDYYYFNDPIAGKNVKYTKAKVEVAYRGMSSQAIVVESLS